MARFITPAVFVVMAIAKCNGDVVFCNALQIAAGTCVTTTAATTTTAASSNSTTTAASTSSCPSLTFCPAYSVMLYGNNCANSTGAQLSWTTLGNLLVSQSGATVTATWGAAVTSTLSSFFAQIGNTLSIAASSNATLTFVPAYTLIGRK